MAPGKNGKKKSSVPNNDVVKLGIFTDDLTLFIWNDKSLHLTFVIPIIMYRAVSLDRKLINNFFFHSFIGYSSCNIQYKFIIHPPPPKKKRSKNPKRVGATGLRSHARNRP